MSSALSASPPVSLSRCLSARFFFVWWLILITEKASGLQETAGPEQAEDPASEPRLPATLVRIPAEPREKVGE